MPLWRLPIKLEIKNNDHQTQLWVLIAVEIYEQPQFFIREADQNVCENNTEKKLDQ